MCAPNKKQISKDAGVSEKDWKYAARLLPLLLPPRRLLLPRPPPRRFSLLRRYILSFGGAAGPGPKMNMIGDDREASEEAFADGFVTTYKKAKAEFGFDGVDMDIENSLSTPLLSAFRRVFKKLHDHGGTPSPSPNWLSCHA